MGFQTHQYELSKLLDDVADGDIQLPDFQRGYKWDEERIRSLLVTIMLGHPLGVIMLLATGNDQVRFKPKPIEGAGRATSVAPEWLLLDGQQRLTSLFQSLTGSGVVDTEDVRGKQVSRRFYVDIAKALDPASDPDDVVIALPGDGIVRAIFGRAELDASTPEREQAAGLFPFRLVFDSGEAFDWLVNHPDLPMIKKFQNEILKPMIGYKIPGIALDKDTSKAAVATVFEKVNTGGLPLNTFELLTATFAGDAAYFAEHGTDFRLNDDWLITQTLLGQHPVLREMQNTDFLQAVSLLVTFHSAGATSARKGDILRLRPADYLRWADQVREALVWVAHFFAQEHIHVHRDVPYQSQIVPLTVIRVVLGADADLNGVQARLRQWFWCGVLGELYGSIVETRFARDLEQVPPWARQALGHSRDVPTPNTVSEASFFESRLQSLRTRNSAAYKGIHALVMARQSRDWLQHKLFDHAHFLMMAVDIHHVFPQDWCKKNQIDPDLMNSIVNKTPLAAGTNRFIGGAAPSAYLPKVQQKAGLDEQQLDTILDGHLIDPVLLRADDFAGFFLARRAALVEVVEQAMGKRVQRDLAADEFVGGEEDVAAFSDRVPAIAADNDFDTTED